MFRKAKAWLYMMPLALGLAAAIVAIIAWLVRRRQQVLGEIPEDFEIKLTPEPMTPRANLRTSLPDNLTLMNGVGPRLAVVLNEAGITNFAQLAQLTPEDLRAILPAASIRLANYDTWPEQARQLMTRTGT
jgi:predicted flap endonuclease-1-like 5' DNA nuclease